MKIEIDKDIDIAYIYVDEEIRDGEVSKTIEVNNNIVLDFNEGGKLLGLEVLNMSKNLSEELLNSLAVSR